MADEAFGLVHLIHQESTCSKKVLDYSSLSIQFSVQCTTGDPPSMASDQEQQEPHPILTLEISPLQVLTVCAELARKRNANSGVVADPEDELDAILAEL